MGGALILVSIAISTLLWADLRNRYVWVTLLVTLAFGGIGFVDDYKKLVLRNSKGLAARHKYLGQSLFGFAAALYLFKTASLPAETTFIVPFFKNILLDMGWFYVVMTYFVIVGTSNAVNLTDGLDGLATGLAIPVAITFAILSYVTGRADWSSYLGFPHIGAASEMTVVSLALVGACVGFLWYNSHPAEIFMGDTGSLMLGGIMGFLALMLKKEILLLIVGGVFVMEGISVMLQVASYKLRKGKRIFLMAPLHHHFEMKGWAENKVVMRFWILGGLFAILSLTTLKIH